MLIVSAYLKTKTPEQSNDYTGVFCLIFVTSKGSYYCNIGALDNPNKTAQNLI